MRPEEKKEKLETTAIAAGPHIYPTILAQSIANYPLLMFLNSVGDALNGYLNLRVVRLKEV